MTAPRINPTDLWKTLPKPFVGLAPMDGITDTSFRRIVALVAKPDFMVTEFVSVKGILYAVESELLSLVYHESERPVIAQLFGYEPEDFFLASQLVCAMGFDGVDINMGCPARGIASKGSGASLIKEPERAQAIIRMTKRGVEQWAGSGEVNLFNQKPKVKRWFEEKWLASRRKKAKPGLIPVSVKTRLGVQKNTIKEWLPFLLEMKPQAITIHGRTLAQAYKGDADWQAIGDAVRMARGSGTLILGNGDIDSLGQARQRVRETGVDGVMIGRAALGNPWVFSGLKTFRKKGTSTLKETRVSPAERLTTALEQAKLFEKFRGRQRFAAIRKHLAWYCSGFEGASQLRAQLVHTNSSSEVAGLLKPYLKDKTLYERN